MRNAHVIVFLIAVFLAALSFRVYKIGELSSWQDETKEAFDVHASTLEHGTLSGQMVNHVKRFAQPPVGHYFEELFINNFGLTVTGIRLHSAVFGALFCVLLAFLFLQITGDSFQRWALLLIVVPVMQPHLIYYSQEARPYMAGTFFSLLMLLDIYNTVFRRNARFSLYSFFASVFVQLVFFLSLGFQPVVVILTSSLSLLPLLFFPAFRRRVVRYWLSSLAAFLAYLPWQLIALKEYSASIKGSGSGTLGKIASIAENFTPLFPDKAFLDTFYSFTTGFKIDCASLVYPVAFLVVIASSFFLARRDRKDTSLGFNLYLGAFAVLFPIAHFTVFNRLIEYKIQPRYYIAAAPFVLVFLFSCFSTLMKALSVQGLAFARIRGCVSVALSIVVAFTLAFVEFGSSGEAYKDRKENYKELFSRFDKRSEKGDGAYQQDYRLGQAYHFYKNEKFDEVPPFDQIYTDIRDGRINGNTERIFLFLYNARVADPYGLWKIRNKGYFEKLFRGNTICLVLKSRPNGMFIALEKMFTDLDGKSKTLKGESRKKFVKATLELLRTMNLEAKTASSPG